MFDVKDGVAARSAARSRSPLAVSLPSGASWTRIEPGAHPCSGTLSVPKRLSFGSLGLIRLGMPIVMPFDGATSDAPARRADAKKRQEALRGRVAFVQIVSDTGGATITLDGAEVGRTPQQRPIVVDPGAHEV